MIHDPNGEFGLAGALVGAGIDLAVQGLLVYSGQQKSISWTSVVVSGAAGATGVGISSVIAKSAARYGASKAVTFAATFVAETGIAVGEQALKGEEVNVGNAVLNVAGGHIIGAAAGQVTDMAGNAINRIRGLSKARAARDLLSGELAARGRPPATVTGGYNTKTGEVAARACGGGQCAETHVLDALGGAIDDVRFTEAVRPRTGNEVPICPSCEATFGRDKFPPNAKFKTDE
jgi:hypothetical protein